jgi:hypothetical protein
MSPLHGVPLNSIADNLHITNKMNKKTTVLLLTLVLCSAAVPRPAGAIEGLAFGLGLGGALTLTNGEGDYLTTKAQAAGNVSLLLDIPLFPSWFLSLGFDLHNTSVSGFSGGWYYRSHLGNGLLVSAGYKHELPATKKGIERSIGTSLGGSFNFDRYKLTGLLFFYPGLFLEPFFELGFPKAPRHSLSLLVPFEYYFRKDLAFSGSLGIAVLWRYYLTRRER